MIAIKRAYEKPAKEDGTRVLIDRLWPRGVSKEDAQIDRWAKDLAPSTELRKWFDHDPAKWEEFQERYTEELAAHRAELEVLAKEAKGQRVTLVYGAKDEKHNDAVVLANLLNRKVNSN